MFRKTRPVGHFALRRMTSRMLCVAGLAAAALTPGALAGGTATVVVTNLTAGGQNDTPFTLPPLSFYAAMTTPLASLPGDFAAPDTVLEVRTSGGSFLHSNDDGGSGAVGTTSVTQFGSVVRHGSTAGASFIARVRGFSGSSAGAYAYTSVLVTPATVPDFVEIEPNNTLATSQPIVVPPSGAVLGRGSLSLGESDFYTFAVSPGDIVSIMTIPTANVPDDFDAPDTRIAVYGTGAAVIIDDDDAGSDEWDTTRGNGYGSAIRYLATSGGAFHFSVRGYDPTEAGPYLLLISRIQGPRACCDVLTGACTVTTTCPPGTTPAANGNGACTPSTCEAPGTCACTWDNGAYDRRDAQLSHLGGAVPNGVKAADDFYLCEGFLYQLRRLHATLLTTTTPGLVKPKAELWSDCNGCPDHLLYTFDRPTVTETGATAGLAQDGRPLRIVDATFDLANELTVNNRYVTLKGGTYWLSVYGVTDGLCPTMQMCDVTYWGTSGNQVVKGLPAKKISGAAVAYNQWDFPQGTCWTSVADDCCIGCTDLNFSVCADKCKIVVDNGEGRRQVALEPVGSTSQFADALSSFETRSADDFALPPLCRVGEDLGKGGGGGGPGLADWRICYIEGCVLTNCPVFDGAFEIYANDCHKPNFAFRVGRVCVATGTASKIVPLNYSAIMDGRPVQAYRLEFHDLGFTLRSGQQYWISIGVRYTFSLNERAFFCYNADCRRSCLIHWNDGRVLTNTTLDLDASRPGPNQCTSPTICNGWAAVGQDFSFLIAADSTVANINGAPAPTPPACQADFNHDGGVNVQDVFDYLHAWFTGCP